MSQRIEYEIENRASVFEQIEADGKVVVEDVTINLVDGRLTNCFVEVIDAPATEPDLLAAADERILELEYEILLLQEGLT